MTMKRATLIGMTIAMVWVPRVYAEPSSTVAFDAPTRALLASGDIEKGRTLAESCQRCHGTEGVSKDPVNPVLAGQPASYLFKQLVDYKEDSRENKDMSKRARKLDEQEMADLSAFYASLPAPPRQSRADEATLSLVFQGDEKRMIKPCASCHGRDGEGGKRDTPAISGQALDYFVTTMTELKEGDRVNDIYSRMRLIAEALTDDEIEALAAYYAAPASAHEQASEGDAGAGGN